MRKREERKTRLAKNGNGVREFAMMDSVRSTAEKQRKLKRDWRRTAVAAGSDAVVWKREGVRVKGHWLRNQGRSIVSGVQPVGAHVKVTTPAWDSALSTVQPARDLRVLPAPRRASHSVRACRAVPFPHFQHLRSGPYGYPAEVSPSALQR